MVGGGRTHPDGQIASRLSNVRIVTHRTLLPILAFVVLASSGDAQDASATDHGHGGFWARWFKRSDYSKAEQPHWLTPLATTTPRLEQEFRSDVDWSQAKPGGPYTEIYGNTKGFELIPVEKVEIIAAVPAFIVHNNPAAANGWGDFDIQGTVGAAEPAGNASAIGRMRLMDRVGFTFGTGVQIAISQFHNSDHNIIFSMRAPF